jgi:hypothetical protein
VKRILFAAALSAAAILAFAPAAGAQVFGQFTGAEVLPVNGHETGAYLVASDNVLGLLGQLRLSFYPGVDFGFQGGLSRLQFAGGDRTLVRLGSDFKIAVTRVSQGFPVDLALGGALGVESSDDYHVLTLMPQAVASHAYPMGQTMNVTPYLGAGISFRSLDASPTRENNFSIPLRLGADMRVMTGVRVTAELQLHLASSFGDNVGFLTGVNLPF